MCRYGEYTTFDPPNCRGTAPIKVGYYWDANAGGKKRGFLFRDGEFAFLAFPDSSATRAKGINAGGEIVGYYLDANSIAHGFLLKNVQYESIDYPDGAVKRYVVSITDADRIAGGHHDDSGQIPRIVGNARGTFVDFAPPPALVCENGIEVRNMSPNDEIVRRCCATSWYARSFLLRDGMYTQLTNGPRVRSSTRAISRSYYG